MQDNGAMRLGLLFLLIEQREQREPGHRRERQDARRDEQQQPAAKWDAGPHGRAYFFRKALISSILSCGSPGTGCVPTTRFIHSMFSCMRATTAGHCLAL